MDSSDFFLWGEKLANRIHGSFCPNWGRTVLEWHYATPEESGEQSSGDAAEASASANRTPRVGVILSSFAGGEDHFGGTKFASLPEPKPVNAELTDAQVEAMTKRAVELGTDSQGGLARSISRDQSVIVLVDKDADPTVVATVVSIIKQRQPQSLTIVTDATKPFSGAECVNPATAESMVMPAPGIFLAARRVVQSPEGCFTLRSSDLDRTIASKGRPAGDDD